MASCQPCGDLPPGGSRAPCQPCQPCPPCPCTIPIISESLPKYQVNPCDPNRARNQSGGDPCCYNVCVPVTQPCVPQPLPRPQKKKRYVQPPRPKSFAPTRRFIPPTSKMEDDTVYRKSYIPVDTEKPGLVIPTNNLCVGEGKFSDDTVNRMSYLPVKAPRVSPIYPCEHRLLGDGPMQDLTTQRHDYVPKPIDKPCAIRPVTNLFTSDLPLSDQTVNRLSYMPVDLDKVKVHAFRPTNAIKPAIGKMDGNTVQKMSYQPWEPLEPMDMPWARKPKYVQPKLRMEDNTIQKASYMPPGEFVDIDDDEPCHGDAQQVPCPVAATPPPCCQCCKCP